MTDDHVPKPQSMTDEEMTKPERRNGFGIRALGLHWDFGFGHFMKGLGH